jgi:hypothetical protein
VNQATTLWPTNVSGPSAVAGGLNDRCEFRGVRAHLIVAGHVHQDADEHLPLLLGHCLLAALDVGLDADVGQGACLANHAVACPVSPYTVLMITRGGSWDDDAMAQKHLVELTDDLDGSSATETITFSLDGATYEIDLNDDNATRFRKSLDTFVDNARKINGPRRPAAKRTTTKTTAKASSASTDANEARSWLREHGHEVSDRGRIKNDLIALFQEASG